MNAFREDDSTTCPDLTALFEKYRDRLCYYLTRSTGGDFSEAENIAHDCFVLLMEKTSSGAVFPNEKAAAAFLFSAGRNLSMNARRKGAFRRLADTLIGLSGGLFARRDPFADAEALADFEAALSGIPEAMREVMVLKYIAELAEDQIAGILGISVGTVKSRYYNGSLKMAERLSGYPVSDGDDRK